MSDVFFRELELPDARREPRRRLGHPCRADRGGDGRRWSESWIADRPALVVVYGDVNSTLAASLVAPSSASRSAHVEAGLR